MLQSSLIDHGFTFIFCPCAARAVTNGSYYVVIWSLSAEGSSQQLNSLLTFMWSCCSLGETKSTNSYGLSVPELDFMY